MKNFIRLSATTAAMVAATAASAATQTGSIGVTASVGSNCVVSTTPIAFGAYDPAAATALNGTGTVALVCTTGATPAIAVDLGTNASSGQRRLTSGANTLNYNVFRPGTNAAGAACAYTTAYDTVAPGFALTAAPSTASRSYNICGQIPALQAGAVTGSYTDTLTVTVTF